MGTRYSDEQLLSILRTLAAALGRSPSVSDMHARRDLPAPRTYTYRFGSWNAALAAAGLEPHPHTPAYTSDQLLEALRALAAELGRPPRTTELRGRPDLPSPSTYRLHFGSWSAALRAAGLEPRRGWGDRTYSDQELLDDLRALAAELGRSPTQAEMLARPDLPTPATYRNRFGSWSAAQRAAGLRPNRQQPGG
jgi:hypothetical protein